MERETTLFMGKKSENSTNIFRKQNYCVSIFSSVYCKIYCFAMQKSRFWYVKSQFLLFDGTTFVKQMWFYVVESIKVVACIFASMLWFVLLSRFRLVFLRQFAKDCLCGRYLALGKRDQSNFSAECLARDVMEVTVCCSIKRKRGRIYATLPLRVGEHRCALVFLLPCEKVTNYCSRQLFSRSRQNFLKSLHL